MFGQNFAQTLINLDKYITKYDETDVSSYLNTLLWSKNSTGKISFSKVEPKQPDSEEFVSEDNSRIDFQLTKIEEFEPKEKSQPQIRKYLEDLYSKTNRIGNNDDFAGLHYCLYVPLYDWGVWEDVKLMIRIIKSSDDPVYIDLVGFSADMMPLFCEENEKADDSVRVFNDIIALKKSNIDHIDHFMIMQNRHKNGKSLDLSADLLGNIIGEFVLQSIENYPELFIKNPFNSDMQAFGLSVLYLDKYFFTKYLLQKAYIWLMDKEEVNQEGVDINAAANRVQDVLKDNVNLLSEFIDKEIATQLEKEQNAEKIIVNINPKIEEKIGEIENAIKAIIRERDLSIPAKRSIFAFFLAQDYNGFSNYLVNDRPFLLYDIEKEAVDMFVEANNLLLEREEKDTGKDTVLSEAILSENRLPVENPVDKIRQNYVDIQRSMDFIRKLESEIQDLESHLDEIEESKKCLIEGEFYVFGDQRFRLLPEIEEVPLKEDYVPHRANAVSIDLRKNFSDIKSQGQQGSCTAHALTSIYEYILKSNKAEKADLSEAFLYYNARKKASTENIDEGSRYDYAVESLVESGICEESLMPYNPDDYTTPPSREAFDNALTRRVRKAVNVKREINDLKSALEDGYPVAISAVLYDSFGQGHKGIVSLPTQNEMESVQNEENKNRYHAMVICGYSDENRLFIVRNSWGTDFGDDGYCYMPYSYITDANLVHFAAAITEVETFSAKGIVQQTELDFDEYDTRIKLALKQNILNEEYIQQSNCIVKRNALINFYNKLLLKIRKPQNRKILIEASEKRYNSEISELQIEYDTKDRQRFDVIDAFNSLTRRQGFIIFGIITVLLLLIYVMFRFFSWDDLLKLSNGCALPPAWIRLLFSAIVACVPLLYFSHRKRELKYLETLSVTVEDKENQLLDSYNRENLRENFIILGTVAGLFVMTCVLFMFFEKYALYLVWVLLLSSVVIACFLLLYFPYRKRLKKRIENLLKEELLSIAEEKSRKQTDLTKIRTKMHTAEKLIDETVTLQHEIESKSSSLKAFLNNLITWYKEAKEEESALDASKNEVKPPFIPLLQEEFLDGYFEKDKVQITGNIYLCELFLEKFKLEEKKIRQFKEELKNTLGGSLNDVIKNFDIWQYISGDNSFEYLEKDSKINERLNSLDQYSKIFVYSRSAVEEKNPRKYIFMNTPDETHKTRWENLYSAHFASTECPQSCTQTSKYKISFIQLEDL
jgi:C1A family cysteine protease